MTEQCDYGAGFFGGASGVLTGHPFDTVKVIQQIHGGTTKECMKRIYKHQGFKGFFRGIGFPLITSGAINSTLFGIYGGVLDRMVHIEPIRWYNVEDEMKFILKREELPPKLGYSEFFIAGSIAGCISVFFGCPIDMVKMKLQVAALEKPKQSHFPSVLATRNIFRAEGMKGFYRGGYSMILRDTFAGGVYMTTYEFGAKITKDNTHEADMLNFLGLFIAGGVAGTASWMIAIPIDVIKSQIQLDDPTKPKYKGYIDCTKKILAEHGVRGLFRGALPLILRGFPVNAIGFTVFEKLYKKCTDYYHKR